MSEQEERVFPPLGHSLTSRHWEVRQTVKPQPTSAVRLAPGAFDELTKKGTHTFADPVKAKAHAVKMALSPTQDYTGEVTVVCVRTIEEQVLLIDTAQATDLISNLGG
jgi:hypothetical protein